MASERFVGALAILAFVLPAVAMATQYTVGEDQGWTNGVNYEAWAKGKVFYVGDQLVFKYNKDAHNVFRVNGTAFKDCIIPPANQSLHSGNDVITLATSGQKWYICGVSDHCADYGQKLAINVTEKGVSPAPAPAAPEPVAPPPVAPAPAAPSPASPAPGQPAPSNPATPSNSTPSTVPPAQPPSAAHGISVSGHQLLIAAMVAAAFLAV